MLPPRRARPPLLPLLLLLLLRGSQEEALGSRPPGVRLSAEKETRPLQPVWDDDEVLPAPVHAVLQQDSNSSSSTDLSSSSGMLGLVASVGGSTAATAHAVSALMYEELAHRLQQLQQQQQPWQPQQQQQQVVEDGAAASVAQLRMAMARLSLLQQQQQQRDVEQGAGSAADDNQQRQQQQQQLDPVFLRKYLADSDNSADLEIVGLSEEEAGRPASGVLFAGVRAARMQDTNKSSGSSTSSSGTGSVGGLPSTRVRRDVEAALSLAILSARFSLARRQRQAELMVHPEANGDGSRRGYVLADSCVAVDYRAVVREAAAAAAVGGTAAASFREALKGRYDAETESCSCPAGWRPCDKEEAERDSYGWRNTLDRACREQQKRPQAGLQMLAFTKGVHSFGCDGSERSARETADMRMECASAAFVLCREKAPRCGVSEWSEWSSCSAPCGEGLAYRWRRPLLQTGGEAAGEATGSNSAQVEFPRSCMPYHLEERRSCRARAECPSFVGPEPCFWAYAKAEETQSVYAQGSCACSEALSLEGNEGSPASVAAAIPLTACSAEEAAYSFSQWRHAMLRYCFGRLDLSDKPHKLVKYSRLAATTRVGLASLGFVDCSGGWGALSPTAMAAFCSEGGPMLCRRTRAGGATVPFAVDGYEEQPLSVLEQTAGGSPLHALEEVEGFDSSWLAFLSGASLAALLLLAAYLQKRRLLLFCRSRGKPAAAAAAAAAAAVAAAASSAKNKAAACLAIASSMPCARRMAFAAGWLHAAKQEVWRAAGFLNNSSSSSNSSSTNSSSSSSSSRSLLQPDAADDSSTWRLLSPPRGLRGPLAAAAAFLAAVGGAPAAAAAACVGGTAAPPFAACLGLLLLCPGLFLLATASMRVGGGGTVFLAAASTPPAAAASPAAVAAVRVTAAAAISPAAAAISLAGAAIFLAAAAISLAAAACPVAAAAISVVRGDAGGPRAAAAAAAAAAAGAGADVNAPGQQRPADLHQLEGKAGGRRKLEAFRSPLCR
ncbi:hypothetical protein Efla_001661 [Eimeria flavescens]